MSEHNNLYERVDGIESKIDDASTKIDGLTQQLEGIIDSFSKQQLSQSTNRVKPRESTDRPTQLEQRRTIKNFIAKSKKEYIWLGSVTDFKKEKNRSIVLMLCYLGISIISTIISSCAIGIYSTCALFENIWLIMVAMMIRPVTQVKYANECETLSFVKCFHFNYDDDGVLRMGALKKRYKVFFALNCITAIVNIIVIWCFRQDSLAIASTIFEVINAVFSGVSFYSAFSMFCGFIPLRFTGESETNKKRVVLIFMPTIDKLFTEEEYKKQFPYH